MDKRILIGLCLALGLLAGGLRFYRLGDWPFHRDEVPTLDEVTSLLTPLPGPPTTQTDRLPRIVPLGYSLLALGYECFGRDEFGTRVMGAIFGTLHVLLVFLLLDRTLGRPTALATALLVALWPEHLYRSQENRFYMFAAVGSSLAMLLGALAVERRSRWLLAGACLAAFAAVLCQTVQGLVFGGLFVTIVAASWAARDGAIARRLLPVLAAGALLACAFFVWYLLPLIRGWNTGAAWGYGVGHSVAAGVSQLGWPVALLAVVGAALSWQAGGARAWYWLSWAGLWAAASLVLPLILTYHPAYTFPLALGVLVLAGRAIALVWEALQPRGALVAASWLLTASAFNLPSLISHYRDGSCHDIRTAASYVSAHWQAGDGVAAFSPQLLKYYTAPGIEPLAIGTRDPVASLRTLATQADRLWIVVPVNRAGLPEALQSWLGANCAEQLRIRKMRFDFYENVTEVYLYQPKDRVQVGMVKAGQRRE